MNLVPMVPIDKLVEIWMEAHKEALATRDDNDLSWWQEACKYLHPDGNDAEDHEILGGS